MHRYTVVLLCLLLAACSSQSTEQVPAPDLGYFFGMYLIPGDGREPIPDAVMIVENGIIKQIGRSGELQAPQGAARYDVEGNVVMPVLINAHGHLGLLDGTSIAPEKYSRDSVMADLIRYDYYGVAAELSGGTDTGDAVYQVRDEQGQGGATAGARVLTAGRGITVTGGMPANTAGMQDIPLQVSTEAEAREAVAELAAQSADVIKIWVDDAMGRLPKLSPELYGAIIDEAHRHNLKVFAQVFSLADAKGLLRAGVDAITHGIRDREIDDEFIALMQERNVPYIPALTALEASFVYLDGPQWLGEQSMREAYPAQLASQLRSPEFLDTLRSDPNLPRLRQQYATAQKNLKTVADANVRVVLGTDSGFAYRLPGYFEHRELELMVEAGLTPEQAILAATVTPATLLGLQDLGTIEPGKSADFLVLSDNPLENIYNSREIQGVVRHGKKVDRVGLMMQLSQYH